MKKEDKIKKWQTLYDSQKKVHIPYPIDGFLCYKCPDCGKRLGGEVLKEFFDESTNKKYPNKSYILWLCECGYEYAEFEEAQ